MNRCTVFRAVTISLASAAVLAGPATAQAPSVIGTWSGTAKTEADGERASVPVRIVIRKLTVGQESGTIRSGPRGSRCTGRLTLRARERGGYTFRDRRTSGRPSDCTNGDRVFVKREGARLAVSLRPGRTQRTIRFSLRRAG
jgi:hypothetical protein